eukprot:gene241-858_t
MADIRRERRRSDRGERLRPSRSRSRSPRNQRLRSRSPRRDNSPPPRPYQGRQQRDRDARDRKLDETKHVPAKIDREKTCPFLLRVFVNQGRHNRLDEYTRHNVPKDELRIYTWKDATLKELMSLVKDVNPKACRKGTYFDFATIFPDPRRGNFLLKDIGTTCSGVKSADDAVTLAERKFQIGDYLDIAISTPRERRDVF